MRNNIFISTEPDNYSAQDNMKHLYFKDYKHLTGVKWQADSEPLFDKVIAAIAFIMLFLLILFI
jgi:hypothetical protein